MSNGWILLNKLLNRRSFLKIIEENRKWNPGTRKAQRSVHYIGIDTQH